MKIIIYFTCYLVVLLFFQQHCFCQEKIDQKEKIIGIFSEKYLLAPPIGHNIEVKITNGIFSYRNILLNKDKIKKEYYMLCDSFHGDTVIKQMDKLDYDSLINFIENSGLLSIDLSYTKPDSTSGFIINNYGDASFGYVIETSLRKIYLPISDSRFFIVPKILKDFDVLFVKYSNKYLDKVRK